MSTHDNMTGRGAPDDDTLAAEYVLHLLDPSDRDRVEKLMEVDGAWRARVAEWSERLIALTDDIDPVPPPSELRMRLERSIADTAVARPRRKWSFGNFLAGGLAAALVAVLAIVFLPRVQPPYSGPVYTADVGSEEQALVVQATYDPSTSTLTVTRQQGQAPEGRDLQMWLLTEDQPPHAVGILPEEGSLTIPVIPFWAQRIPTGQFAVSEEPPGGSTDETGPRGQILAVGEVQEL